MEKEQICELLNLEYKARVISVLDRFNISSLPFVHNLRRDNGIKISKSTRTDDVGHYSYKTNSLVYTDRDSYIHELFHVASSLNGETNGIVIHENNNYFGTSLNEGITDYFSYFAGNKKFGYPVEMFCAHIINLSYGMDIFKHYFKNDGVSFYNGREEIYNLVCDLDNYYNSILNIYYIMSEMPKMMEKIRHGCVLKNVLLEYNNYKNKLVNEKFNAKLYLYRVFSSLSELPNMSKEVLKDEMKEFNFSDVFTILEVNIDDLFQIEL